MEGAGDIRCLRAGENAGEDAVVRKDAAVEDTVVVGEAAPAGEGVVALNP